MQGHEDDRIRSRIAGLGGSGARDRAGTPDPVEGRDDGQPAPVADGGQDLRRRAARAAMATYTAAHGDPLTHDAVHDGGIAGGRRGARWAVTRRAALAAGAAVAAVAIAATLRSGPSVPWVDVPASAAQPVRADGPSAAPTAAGSAPGPGEESSAPGGTTGACRGAGEPGAGGAGAGGAAVVVHVVGQVLAPGVVDLPAGSRVAEAIDAAGGAAPEADLGAVNLARVVTDGEQIHVPRPGEAAPAPPVADGGGAAPGEGDPELVDLNTADVAALDELPGIGPVLAARIVEWREANGPFGSVEDLGEVTGIGPSLLADLRPRVRV